MYRVFFITIAVLALVLITARTFLNNKSRPMPTEHNSFSITGITKNIGSQAAVMNDSMGIYFVAGQEKWENSWLDKTVKVTGDLSGITSDRMITNAVVLLLQQEGYWVTDSDDEKD